MSEMKSAENEDPGMNVVANHQPEEEPARVLTSLPGGVGAASSADASSLKLLRSGTEPIKREPKPPSALETILGDDERVRITDTENAPWRMICSLVIRGPTATMIGTGWFAGPRTIITAGHCVFHPKMGGAAEEITIYPGRDGQRSPYGQLTSKRFSTTKEWLDTLAQDFDYAAIHLGPEAEEITKTTGWFSTTVLNDAALKNQCVNVSGYPGDKGLGVLRGSEQWFHAKQVVSLTPLRIFYDVDTMAGQSGAPTWMQTPEGPRVVGVHAYGASVATGVKTNSAPRITAEVFEMIKGWIENT